MVRGGSWWLQVVTGGGKVVTLSGFGVWRGFVVVRGGSWWLQVVAGGGSGWQVVVVSGFGVWRGFVVVPGGYR